MTKGAIPELSLDDLDGATVIGSDGEKVGTVADVYYDGDTSEPEWVLVSTGLLGSRKSFVPLRMAELRHGELLVPFPKDLIGAAPNIDDEGELSVDEEADLARHYGMAYATDESGSGMPTGAPGEESVAGMASSDVGMAGEPQSVDESQVSGAARRPSTLQRLRRALGSD